MLSRGPKTHLNHNTHPKVSILINLPKVVPILNRFFSRFKFSYKSKQYTRNNKFKDYFKGPIEVTEFTSKQLQGRRGKSLFVAKTEEIRLKDSDKPRIKTCAVSS